jgi:hypothetical protein
LVRSFFTPQDATASAKTVIATSPGSSGERERSERLAVRPIQKVLI